MKHDIQLINTTTGEVIGTATSISVEMKYYDSAVKTIASSGEVSGQMTVQRIDTSMIVDEIADANKPTNKEVFRRFLERKHPKRRR